MNHLESDILGRIIRAKLDEIACREAEVSLGGMADKARSTAPARGFAHRMWKCSEQAGAGFICEIKRASPSKGTIRDDFDIPAIAQDYERNGAACLSVLTDRFFEGELAHLTVALNSTILPILRKDFIVSSYQVYESRAFGADAILLLASVLDPVQIQEFSDIAKELGMDCLIEIHDDTELEKAVDAGIGLVGVNNRNLSTFEVSLEVTAKLCPLVPEDRLIVSESGIGSPADVARLKGYGVKGFLVGEALMACQNPGTKLTELQQGLQPNFLASLQPE